MKRRAIVREEIGEMLTRLKKVSRNSVVLRNIVKFCNAVFSLEKK